MPEIVDDVRREIEALHDCIARWFRGEGERSQERFSTEFISRLDAQFTNIQPSGQVLFRDELLGPIESAFGANPDFRITISNVTLLSGIGRGDRGLLVATYVEHQTGARNSSPAANDRISTVVFHRDDASGALIWLHIHETALLRPA